MGLELVELQLEVEKAFGLSIPDRDSAGLDTVGKLYDYIMEHRFQGKEYGCLTNVAFYKLRRALMSVLGIARGDVQLSAELAPVIPTRRRRLWSDLQTATGLRLPSLVRPVWIRAVTTTVECAFALAVAVLLPTKLGNVGWLLFWPALGMACGVIYVLEQAMKPLAISFPRKVATVGGLTEAILRMNYGAISDECQRANAKEAWNTLRTLIAEELGVRLDDVTKEASFVKDLNAG